MRIPSSAGHPEKCMTGNDQGRKGQSPINSAAGKFVQKGKTAAIGADGKNGADVYDGSRYYHIDALNQKRVDATGAGDSFAAGFVGALMRNESAEPPIIEEALKCGIINSTSVVNKIGAQSGLLTLAEIEHQLSNGGLGNIDVS